MPWSHLSGSARLGETPAPRAGAGSLAALTGRAWRLGALTGALLLWGAGGLVAYAARGRLAPETFLLVLAPLLVAGLVLFLARGATRLAWIGAGLGTLSLVAAVAGHLLHPRGAPVAHLVPPEVGGLMGLLLLPVALLLAPLYAGVRLHAMAASFAATGRERTGSGALATAARELGAAGLLLAFLRGCALPGLLAYDALATIARRVAARARGQAHDRVRLDVEAGALADALAEVGATVTPESAGLRVLLPGRPEGARRVSVRERRLAFPLADARVLEVTGASESVAAFRRVLEGPLAHVGLATWSRPARRLERRLNGLLASATDAASLEERSLLMEDAERLARLLDARELGEEEHVILRVWKMERLQHTLARRLLAEPVGMRREGHFSAPAPAVPPPLATLLDAGGLQSARRIVFAPHWIVPVQTPWGQEEVLVDALAGKPVAEGGRRLLDVLAERGPTLFLPGLRGATFLPAPAPSGALLRELRTLPGVRVEPSLLEGPLELVYLPLVQGEAGPVHALSGEPAAGALPVARAP